MSNFMSVFEDLDRIYEEDLQQEVKTELTEEVEEVEETEEVEEVDETETPEETVEEVPAEDFQSVLECSKCGALTLKSKEEILYTEDSNLVNLEDICQFCEATEGFKVLGDLMPTEEETAVEEVADEAAEDFTETDETLNTEENNIEETE